MVDWSLARRIAGLAAGSEPGDGLGLDMGALAAGAEPHVAGYTGLRAAEPVPAAESVGREEWAAVNLDMLAAMLEPLSERLEERLSAAGPLTGALRAAGGATIAAEAGLVIGYLSHRVLGQYELSLLQPETPPRLLFVAPNLVKAVYELEVDRVSFLTWVALHELTHVLQFSGVPWLREHMAGLMRQYLATVDVRLERGAAALPHLREPAKLLESFREGGLVALVQTPEQRRLIESVQAVMAVIEGYSEHVMDVVGREVVPAYEGLREAMEERRRSRSAPERLLQRLLGFDMKLRQYELGKRFCDAVADSEGIESLNRVWGAPEALPTLAELEDPSGWSARIEREREALAKGRPTL
jgi:coenzyme F420 biosynthesis associated uncharacterized protein